MQFQPAGCQINKVRLVCRPMPQAGCVTEAFGWISVSYLCFAVVQQRTFSEIDIDQVCAQVAL